MTILRNELLTFLREYRHAVQCSICAAGKPQSAVVGIAVSDDFEIVFDTLSSSRKAANLRLRPEISFVVGSTSHDAQRTVQFEGIADEPVGPDRDRLVSFYLTVFPDGLERQSWPGLIYFRATPLWLRYSDYRRDPPIIVELDGIMLRQLQ